MIKQAINKESMIFLILILSPNRNVTCDKGKGANPWGIDFSVDN